MEDVLDESEVVWVQGDTGSGKSTDTPFALLEPLDDYSGIDLAQGVLHVVPTNVACRTLNEWRLT